MSVFPDLKNQHIQSPHRMNLPRAYARGFGLVKQLRCLPQILFSLILNVFPDDGLIDAYGRNEVPFGPETIRSPVYLF